MLSTKKLLNHLLAVVLLSMPVLAFAQENSVIKLLVVYNQGVEDVYGNPTTRINHLIQTTNQIYTDSGVNLELSVAHTVKVNYPTAGSAETALYDITQNRVSAFNQIAGLRATHEADMVIFYRPYADDHGSCGIAWVGGSGTNGDFSNPQIKNYMYSHVAVNTCGDYVTAHELGHNLGLHHSRRQDGSGGTTDYALGYGEDNLFTTIMAYQSEFNVDYWTGKVYKFSSPNLTCMGRACGIARGNSQSADAVYALNLTGPQVSEFYGAVDEEEEEDVEPPPDLADIYQQMLTAKAAFDVATLDYDESVALYAAKTQAERDARSAFQVAKRDARSTSRDYSRAVKNYNRSVNRANNYQTRALAFYAKYEAETRQSRKDSFYARYESFLGRYNVEATSAATYLGQATTLQPQVTSTAAAQVAAENAYLAAKTAKADERTLKSTLRSELVSAKREYRALERQYNRMLRQLSSNVVSDETLEVQAM